MLTRESSVNTIPASADTLAEGSQEMARQQRLMQVMKADQQAKYLHLQEETELLLQQLKDLKRQRQAVEERQLVGSSVN
ncbi:MAG: hypothetical protein NW220_18475 [Leptolyngbyaceae cyanobacterium bins.349]|nr:hypothetical protein [Leptolyngbyaceae cyanobacterium bins.349]